MITLMQKFIKISILIIYLFLASSLLVKAQSEITPLPGSIVTSSDLLFTNTTTVTSISIPEKTIQDISAGLYMEVYPSELNLTLNSTGNFSVYVENKNNVNLYCTLTVYSQYFKVSPDGSRIYKTISEEIYAKDFNLDAVRVVLKGLSTNSRSFNVNISTPEDCEIKEECNHICWYKMLCENNSTTYILKLECGDSSYNGLLIERVKVNLLPPKTQKECIENWSCTEWSECYPNGTQYRSCVDLNNCNTTKYKPEEERKCEYVIFNKTNETENESEKSTVCGDGICEIDVGENQTNCCIDCGCQEGYYCENNTCKKTEKLPEKITPIITGLFSYFISNFQNILKIFLRITSISITGI